MQISFYQCTDDPRVLNKNLVPVTTKNCTVYGNNSTESPHIELKYDNAIFSANYLYIPAFNRYYTFETNILPNGAIDLLCTCDYRLSYKNDIRASRGLIIRSTSGNKNIVDSKAKRTNNTRFQFRNLGTCFVPGITYVIVKGS